MISISQKGDFSKTLRFLTKVKSNDFFKRLDEYGRQGVEALSIATPKDSGLTASSWSYEINRSSSEISITWTNSNFNKGLNIAVLIQYGHGTRNGGYVQGRDYINPAMRPIFDQIANSIWGEVKSS